VEFASGEKETASALATQALAATTADASRDEIRTVAQFLAELGRHREALPLWEKLASPARLGYDTTRLIDCQIRLGEHGRFLKVCEQLRLNSVFDPHLIEVEAGIRAHYDMERTIALLRDYIARSPEDRGARLQLSVIGMQLGRPELITSDPGLMPLPENTEPQNWKTIVLVMRHGGHLWEALRFAYRLLRENFGNIEAHRAYLASLFPTGPVPEIAPTMTAEPGTAIAFTEEDATQIEWRVIEDEFQPDPRLDEIGPDHFIAQQVKDKRAGDHFVIAQSSVITKRGKILQVLSKYVYRVQDCGENWLRRFPDHPDVQPVRVVRQSDRGEEFDFTEFFQSFDRILASHHAALDAYRSTALPIHVIAAVLGRNDFEQIIRIATDDSMALRCCAGNAEERTAAMSALKNASVLVLDLTAICTLLLLEALDELPSLGIPMLVSQQTFSEFRFLVEEYAKEGGRTGLGRVGERYQMVEMMPDAVKAQHDVLGTALAKVEQYCKVVACTALAEVPANRREQLISALGEHGAQSIALASASGHVLWTDDQMVGVVAAHEFGVRRVWTQLVMQERSESGVVQAAVFLESTAKMLGWRYYFTGASVPALAAAGTMAAWNPDRWPLKGALEVFRDRAIAVQDVLGLAAGFMVHYTGEIVLPQVRDVVTMRVLDLLADRGEGLAPVRALVRALPGAFGLNVLRASDVVQVVNAWMATRRHIG
jgi:hypothetical protein